MLDTSWTPVPSRSSTARSWGSDFLDRIAAEEDSRRFISRFTIGVGGAQVSHGRNRRTIVDTAARRLEADVGSRGLLVASVSDDHLRGARQSLIEHGRTEALRGPDALQLSVALGLKRAGLASVFVAADQKLCRVAMIEGFTTLNPEQPLTV